MGTAPVRQSLDSVTAGFGDLPAGIACAFAVSLNPVQPYRGTELTYFTKSGDVVRDVTVATRSTWKITNLDTQASYTFGVAAGRLSATPQADGSVTIAISGGVVGFNAPTDTPAGPFSQTFSGHLVLSVDSAGNGTTISHAGTPTDLCAAVAP